MYCGNCGTPTEKDWAFCKQCGHPIEQTNPTTETTDTNVMTDNEPAMMTADTPAASDIPVTSPAAPRAPLSKTAKRNLFIGGGVLVLALAAFLILRLTNGPSTPEQLAEKLNAAVNAGDASQLASYLDDKDSPLHDQQKIALLTEALKNEDTREEYEYEISEALDEAKINEEDSASAADALKKQLQAVLSNDSSWITFAPEQSWRGTRWSVHIEPVEVGNDVSYMQEGVKSTLKIGDLTSSSDTLSDLWPAVYNYTATIDGTYASVPAQGTVKAFNVKRVNETELDQQKIPSITLLMPDGDAKVTLNDKPVSSDQGDYVTIFPAPTEAKFTVSTSVQGVDLKGDLTVTPTDDQNYDLSKVLQQPIAEKALDIVYNASDSLATAINTSNPKALKDVNPDSDYYNRATWEMNEFTSAPKYKLKKVVIDLDSVDIRSDGIQLTATQVYKRTNEDGSVEDKNVNWDYTITQQPNTDHWWVHSGYAGWNNAIGSQHTIDKSATDSSSAASDSSSTSSDTSSDAAPSDEASTTTDAT
ncbi:hypothetical protein [Paenibacillus kandeliae]|uniref:hypothetical protein n=1 Tax=Paenibacillus kandeliae TaxID=3231269 RepID=UPI003F53A894